jgi:Mrp family chromosome partitioning ATPase
VLAVTDAVVLSNRIDGVILVTRAGKTRRDLARRAIFTLRQAGAHLLGGVLNGTTGKMEGYPYHYFPYELEPADQPTSDPQAKRVTIEPFLNEQHVST